MSNALPWRQGWHWWFRPSLRKLAISSHRDVPSTVSLWVAASIHRSIECMGPTRSLHGAMIKMLGWERNTISGGAFWSQWSRRCKKNSAFPMSAKGVDRERWEHCRRITDKGSLNIYIYNRDKTSGENVWAARKGCSVLPLDNSQKGWPRRLSPGCPTCSRQLDQRCSQSLASERSSDITFRWLCAAHIF